MPDPPAATRLFRKEHGLWGVPSEKASLCEYVLDVLRRDFDLGAAVRAVKWFHSADALARDGDADTFRGPPRLGGYVDLDESDVIWLNRWLCELPEATLTRTLVHEVCHVEQLRQPGVRGRRVDDLERAADDVVALLCRGLAG